MTAGWPSIEANRPRALPRYTALTVMTGPVPRLLIADDQADILEALRLFFKGESYETDSVTSPSAVLRALDSHDYDAVLIDLNYTRDTTSGTEGLNLIEQIRDWDPTLPVVVMTAWASVELVVEAMRRGARDFVQKPWDNARLLTVVTNQIELGRALRRGRRLESENRILHDDGNVPIIAASAAMRPVLEMAGRLGPSDANVLVRGENGTGKGVLARALHRGSSRASRPMLAVNIGGLSEGVFESELFGHVRGAFTDAKSDRIGRFELADGGTLFLDEIANLTLNQQARLLRVLETGEFERVGSSQTRRTDVRLISATNADLESEVDRGAFRRDLLFRLNTVEIHLPPLRERAEDVPALAGLFLRQHSLRYRKNIRGFEDDAMRSLLAHRWPGNVRELDHVIERAVLMSDGKTIRSADLGLQQSGKDGAATLDEMSIEEMEALLIRKALSRFDGNVKRAADALGLSRSALYRRIQRYGL